MNLRTLGTVVALSLVAIGCKDETSSKGATTEPAASSAAPVPNTAAQPAKAEPVKAAPAAGAMDCSTPRKTIESQVALIQKGGTAEEFARCFTERQRGKVTQKMVDKSHKEANYYRIEDLYGSEEKVSDTEVKVKMKNGRSLTTLIRNGDMWQADTLWFK